MEKLVAEAMNNPSNTFLNDSYYEHPDESQCARLLINGVEVQKGTVQQMKDAYRLEVGINRKTNVTVQEWKRKPLLGKPANFVTILSRVVRMA
jgi:hypothetical protein